MLFERNWIPFSHPWRGVNSVWWLPVTMCQPRKLHKFMNEQRKTSMICFWFALPHWYSVGAQKSIAGLFSVCRSPYRTRGKSTYCSRCVHDMCLVRNKKKRCKSKTASVNKTFKQRWNNSCVGWCLRMRSHCGQRFVQIDPSQPEILVYPSTRVCVRQAENCLQLAPFRFTKTRVVRSDENLSRTAKIMSSGWCEWHKEVVKLSLIQCFCRLMSVTCSLLCVVQLQKCCYRYCTVSKVSHPHHSSKKNRLGFQWQISYNFIRWTGFTVRSLASVRVVSVVRVHSLPVFFLHGRKIFVRSDCWSIGACTTKYVITLGTYPSTSQSGDGDHPRFSGVRTTRKELRPKVLIPPKGGSG